METETHGDRDAWRQRRMETETHGDRDAWRQRRSGPNVRSRQPVRYVGYATRGDRTSR